MPDRPEHFRCPHCESTSFQRVKVRRANGTVYVTQFYCCTFCTAVFLDPIAFTRGREDRPQRQRSPSSPGTPYQMWADINQRRSERK
jgi:hypothetical protein